MFGILKKYRNLLGRRAATDFNRMAAFLTNFCGDESIDFHRPDDPNADNPPCVAVNKKWIEDKIDERTAPQSPTGTSNLDSGFSGLIGDHSKRGGTFAAGNPGGAGIIVKICCRGMDDGRDGAIFWRPFTITSDGRIMAIDAESDSMGMYTDQ